MPTKAIRRGSARPIVGGPTWNDVRVDPTTDRLFFGTGTSGATEKTLVDSTTVNQPIASPLMTGTIQEGALLGAQNSNCRVTNAKAALADNVAADIFTVTVPNTNLVAAIGLTVLGALGDQDSAEASYWTVAVSRIAGAATKAVASAKSSNANTAGVAGNAAATIAVSGNTGAVGVQQTFTITVKVARSAGAATNHDALIEAQILNSKAAGITLAAA